VALRELQIRIDRLVLDMGPDPGGSAERRALLDDALKRLADRLSSSPLARLEPRKVALERLSIGALSTDELLGPRGAERLADELYAALARSLG
jgi:hypothetical protein